MPVARRLTVGGEGQRHYQVEQTVRDDTGYYLDDSGKDGKPFQLGALYALADAARTKGDLL